MLSPVRADSFTALLPSITTPSTGMLSPGFTTKMSPTATSTGYFGLAAVPQNHGGLGRMTDKASQRVGGLALAFGLQRLSHGYQRQYHGRGLKIELVHVGHDARGVAPAAWAPVMANRAYTLQRKDADAPSATSVSILGAPWARLLKPLMKNFWFMTITPS
jgi:hypothetical protein